MGSVYQLLIVIIMNAEEQIAKQLESVESCENLYKLALELKNIGMGQEELLILFDLFRAKHEKDQNEIKYNAILDTMDYIAGHCSPDKQIY